MHILLVEDDDLLADGMRAALLLAGHSVATAATAASAIAWLAEHQADLVLLDLGLPDQDGLTVLRFIREHQDGLLVIILTARDALRDRVRGLDAGADDYLVKPVALSELAARIRALGRRHQTPGQQLCHGSLMMDRARHEVLVAGEPIALTPREWRLLELLVDQAGELIRKERLLSLLSGWDGEMTANAIEVGISRLRAKLNPHVQIRTVRGYGYLLEAGDHGS